MSIDMYLSASQNQAASVSSMCRNQLQGYEQLQGSIQRFTADQVLKGKGYNSAKALFSSVILPLVRGGILLSEAVEAACKKFPEEYIAQVDSGDLKSEELERQIQEWTTHINDLSSDYPTGNRLIQSTSTGKNLSTDKKQLTYGNVHKSQTRTGRKIS